MTKPNTPGHCHRARKARPAGFQLVDDGVAIPFALATQMPTRPPKARKVPDSQDFITILMTDAGYTASKKFVQKPVGIDKIDFNAGWLFNVLIWPASSIDDLSNVLGAVEASPCHLIIRGAPADPGYVGAWVQRTGSGDVGNFFTPPAGRRWVLIDFDKIQIPNSLSLKKDPVAVCEYLIGLLPAEFHNASYHWQMSSSAGIGDPSKVSMHIWFWLVKPVPDSDLKVWANHVNDQAGERIVDPALFQHVQAHYTAAPIFEGIPNPFPKRSGLNLKQLHAVDLVLPVAAAQPARVRAAASHGKPVQGESGAGFEYHLSRIGDHPGGDGFHAPIVAAAASYVSTHGAEGTDAEVLFEIISAAVLAADATHHSRADIESRASREHILPAIDSALKKFGSQASPRRKARILDGVKPHFESIPMSIEEAAKAMADFASKKS